MKNGHVGAFPEVPLRYLVLPNAIASLSKYLSDMPSFGSAVVVIGVCSGQSYSECLRELDICYDSVIKVKTLRTN